MCGQRERAVGVGPPWTVLSSVWRRKEKSDEGAGAEAAESSSALPVVATHGHRPGIREAEPDGEAEAEADAEVFCEGVRSGATLQPHEGEQVRSVRGRRRRVR